MTNSPRNNTNQAENNSKKKGIAVVGNMDVGKESLFSRICESENGIIKLQGNTSLIGTGKIKRSLVYCRQCIGQ